MPERYFTGNAVLDAGSRLLLSPEESHHLTKVMRARPGDTVILFGGGMEANAVYVELKGKQAEVQVGIVTPSSTSTRVRMHFVVPSIKGGKTEMVVQKLTELGAVSICLFSAEREVAKLGGKLERLERTAIEACKQCERADVPTITEQPDLLAALRSFGLPQSHTLLLYEREKSQLFSKAVRIASDNSDCQEWVIASGPEGGFAPTELAACASVATLTSLGKRILRAETAPVAAAAAVLSVAGEL